MQSRRKRKSRMGTDRIRRLRHGTAACVRRLSAPGHLCWSQVSPTVFSDLSPCSPFY